MKMKLIWQLNSNAKLTETTPTRISCIAIRDLLQWAMDLESLWRAWCVEPFGSTTNFYFSYLLRKASSYSQSMFVGDITRWAFGRFPFLLTWKWENIVSTKLGFIKASTEKGGNSGSISNYYSQIPRWGIQRGAKVGLPRAPRAV